MLQGSLAAVPELSTAPELIEAGWAQTHIATMAGVMAGCIPSAAHMLQMVQCQPLCASDVNIGDGRGTKACIHHVPCLSTSCRPLNKLLGCT